MEASGSMVTFVLVVARDLTGARREGLLPQVIIEGLNPVLACSFITGFVHRASPFVHLSTLAAAVTAGAHPIKAITGHSKAQVAGMAFLAGLHLDAIVGHSFSLVQVAMVDFEVDRYLVKVVIVGFVGGSDC